MIGLLLFFIVGAMCEGQIIVPLFQTAASRLPSNLSASLPQFQSSSFVPDPFPRLNRDGNLSASCSQPNAAVQSKSLFSYSLLESTFTNPALKDFYRTSIDSANLYQVIYDEVKATHTHDAQLIAGSLSLLLEQVLPHLSPLVNAISMTNAISDLFSLGAVITSEEFDDYVDAFINAVSKAMRNDGGSTGSRSVASALLNFLSDRGSASFSALHQFTSILAGHYRTALHSPCPLPILFQQLQSPS